jgi:taurine dioxygenase
MSNSHESHFDVRPMGEFFAAEVIGFSHQHTFSEADRALLVQAWAENVVLCFRDQDLGPGQFLQLASIFGTPAQQPIQRAEYQVQGFPEVRVLSSAHIDTYGDGKPLLIGGTWHTDHSHLDDPPWGTMLHALELPSRGGDTSFMNLTSAYQDLDAVDKAVVDPLIGEHVYLSKYSKRRLQTMTPSEQARAASARHALVRTHAVSGSRGLYFNPIRVERFEGVSEAASQALLDKLIAHGEKPEHIYRHCWRPGDVLLWDNRQALHMVAHDYPLDETRVMHRTLVGSPALARTMAAANDAS